MSDFYFTLNLYLIRIQCLTASSAPLPSRPRSKMNQKNGLIGKFPGKRSLKVGLRTLHLIGIAGVAGGVLLSQAQSSWTIYWYIALATGSAMMLLDLASNFIWCIQLRGLAIYLKLCLLTLLGWHPEYDKALVIAMIIISGVISHASGDLRYYSIWHRRRVDSLSDTKG